jgi:hypothetical protein
MSEPDDRTDSTGTSKHADDIPSIVPDPEAPLRGETVPDDWLDQKMTTASGRPGGYGQNPAQDSSQENSKRQ